MSSNLSLNRVCELCKTEFIARTTVTRFCSHKCSSKSNKIKARNIKIEKSDLETKNLNLNKTYSNYEIIKVKEYLTVKDAAQLLNMSAKTVYRLIERNTINAFQFSERKTLIRKSDIEKYFDFNLKEIEKSKLNHIEELTIHNSYTMQEVADKYQISNSALYNLIKRFDIPKKNQGKFVLVKRQDIDSIFE